MNNKENTDLGIIAHKTIAFYYRLCYYRCITKGKVMTIKVEYINSENTLGTTNGLNWTIYPQV